MNCKNRLVPIGGSPQKSLVNINRKDEQQPERKSYRIFEKSYIIHTLRLFRLPACGATFFYTEGNVIDLILLCHFKKHY